MVLNPSRFGHLWPLFFILKAMSFLAYRTGSHDDELYVARVKSKQLKSNVLPGLPDGKSRQNIYAKGWVILSRSFVLEDECFLPEGGWWRLIARNRAVSLYGTIYWSALHCWWWSAVIASDPTRGSRHDFPSGRPRRTLLFSYLRFFLLFTWCATAFTRVWWHVILEVGHLVTLDCKVGSWI